MYIFNSLLIQYLSVSERGCQETKIHFNHIALKRFKQVMKNTLDFFLVRYQRTDRGEVWSRFAFFGVTLKCQ